MKERPILFSAPMVRALLDGRKTQTRRVVKPQPSEYVGSVHPSNIGKSNLAPTSYFDAYCNGVCTDANPRRMSDHWCWWTPDHRQGPDWIRCPYGIPGDRLWVRETWAAGISTGCSWHAQEDKISDLQGLELRFQADGSEGFFGRWRPSIHMPRWASRILLEITDVRVERLCGLNEAGAVAEGITRDADDIGWDSTKDWICSTAKGAFQALWESINGPETFTANPWVWVIEFKKISP